MRQIEEFSSTYQRLALDCVIWTAGLIIWVWISVLLHWRNVDMRYIYILVTIGISFRLFTSVVALNREEREMSLLYCNYLDTFSYQVLMRMRFDSDMSKWSKREIAHYLNMAMRYQF